MSPSLDRERPDRSAAGRPMTPIYVAVVIIEAVVLSILWWATQHFSS